MENEATQQATAVFLVDELRCDGTNWPAAAAAATAKSVDGIFLRSISRININIDFSFSISSSPYRMTPVPRMCQRWGLYHLLDQCAAPKVGLCHVDSDRATDSNASVERLIHHHLRTDPPGVSECCYLYSLEIRPRVPVALRARPSLYRTEISSFLFKNEIENR